MGMSGLSTATSGIRAAQLNLSIIGHNISNAEIPGYSRQRIIQTTAYSRFVGTSNAGDRMLVGMGTDWNAVHQIRNEFLDFSYRENVSRLSFHSTMVQAGLMVETFLGELHGGYNFQGVLDDMWFSIQELSGHPDGIGTRAMFLATANSFLAKAQETMRGIVDYQHNLDEQIRAMVGEINNTVQRIEDLNVAIRVGESSGDNANDFRDERNRLLDRLSEMIPAEIFYATNGDAVIMSMGHSILSNGVVNNMGLRFISHQHSFVEPVFTSSAEILQSNTSPREFRPWTDYRRPINNGTGNDLGTLNALLAARGTAPANLNSDIQPQYWDPNLSLAANITILTQQRNDAVAAIPGLVAVLNTASVVRDAADLALNGPAGAVATLAAAQTALDVAQAALDADPGNAALLTARNNALTARNLARTARDTAQTAFDDADRAYHQAEMDLSVGRGLEIETQRRVDEFEADIHNWNAHMWSIQHAKIPQAQKNLDRVVNSVISMINDALTGNLRGADGNYLFSERPLDMNGNTGIPLFIRRIDENAAHPDALRPENQNDFITVHSISNWIINPEFLQANGHNFLAFSFNGDPNDNRLLTALQDVWQSNEGPYATRIGEIRRLSFNSITNSFDETIIRAGTALNVQDSYIRFTGSIATDIAESNSFVASQTVLTQQADSMRISIKGVSMDEELNAMLRFQFAFQSAARVLNVLDGMIESVISIGRK